MSNCLLLMIDISVIIPTYKPQDYLWECLDSLINQTFPKSQFEVIIVLNGCGEPYKGRIETYISENMDGMNVKFIHTLQGGVSNARNTALDAAIGEYVTFIDDDDYVSPNFLEELYKKSSHDTIALCYPYVFMEGNDMQMEHPLTRFYEKISVRGRQKYNNARKYFSGSWMKLIPMSVIRDRRFDTQFRNGEDCLYMFFISDKFKYVDFTSPKAIYYRRYRVNSAVTASRSKYELLANGMKMMLGYTKIYLPHIANYSFMFYFTRMLGAVKNILDWERRQLYLEEHNTGSRPCYGR